MRIHQHTKCPRCHVALGRYDTVCWACRHVVKTPGTRIKFIWIRTILELAVGVVALLVLFKFRSQLTAAAQATLRSFLNRH